MQGPAPQVSTGRVDQALDQEEGRQQGEHLEGEQRLTSEGDYAAAKNLIETYGVKVDPALHKEVLERYARLNIAPYPGFIQPRLVPVVVGGKITDVKVEYPTDFAQQMLEYGRKYKFLPNVN